MTTKTHNPADKVERWSIDKLTPYARNSRTHSDEQISQLAASIKEWGWTTPVLVDEDGSIIAGHGRTLAAQRLKMTEVPVMVAKGWSDAKKRAYVIADNKLAMNAGWDEQMLALELTELQGLGFGMELIGFSKDEIAALMPKDPDDDGADTSKYTKKLDDLLFALCDFMDESGAHSVAMSQGGDFIGGGEGTFVKHIKKGKFSRKVMNSFLFRVDRPVKFMGRINEDVNMYVEWGRRGHLFVTVPRLRLYQKETQTNSGGLTEIYLDLGTYVKSFYSVLYAPSCVSITEMGNNDKRIHHQISWRHAVPMILDEQHRKPRLLSRYTNTVQEM
jgi:hypothetical protein